MLFGRMMMGHTAAVGGGSLVFQSAPTTTSASFVGAGGSRAINAPTTLADDDIFFLIFHSQAGGTVTGPTGLVTHLRAVASASTGNVMLFRWNGSGTRPNGGTVTFTDSGSGGNIGGAAWVVRGGTRGGGVHGSATGSSSTSVSGPASGSLSGSITANSLWMHIWCGASFSSITAPTTGFATDAPSYPDSAFLLPLTVPSSNIRIHVGGYGAGAYVQPVAAVSSFTTLGCISMESLA